MKSLQWSVMSSLVLFFVATSTGWAQTTASPPTDCESGSIGNCVGDLLDEQLGMIDEVEGLLDDMQAIGLLTLGQKGSGVTARASVMQADLRSRIDTLRNEHARARGANEATTDIEYDELLEQADKKNGKGCKFSDIAFYESILDANGEPDLALLGLKSIPTPSKFGNSKCDIFEAVNLDDETVRVNERRENMCAKVCTEKPNQQGKSKQRAIGGFVDALSSARGANRALSAQRASLVELGSLLKGIQLLESQSQSLVDDPCAPGTPGPGADLIAARAFNITITVFDGVLVVGNVLTEVLGGVKDVFKTTTNQTALGFNASTAALPAVVIFHISKGIFGVVSGAKALIGDARSIVATEAKIVSSGKLDKGKACTKIVRDDTVVVKGEFAEGLCVSLVCDSGPDIGSTCVDDSDCADGAVVILKRDVADLKVKAGQTNDALAAIIEEMAVMKSLLETNRDLLLTPTGRRPGFKKP